MITNILIAIVLTIIVIVVLIIIALISVKNREPTNSFYTSPQRWSNPVASSNPLKNTCQIYTFPTNKIDISSVETVVPGVPTFNSNILDNLTGSTNLLNCIDNDQIIARQITHTCVGDNSGINLCYAINGDVVPIGTTETYYSPSTIFDANGDQLNACPNLNTCVGELSLISIDFNNLKNCIEVVSPPPVNPNDPAVIMSSCDPTNENQLFRVTRTNMGQVPNANNQTAPFAQFLDRNTNKCLVAPPSAVSDVEMFAQKSLVGATFVNESPIFSTCSTTGTDWLLLPPLPYCINSDVAPKCSIKEITPFNCLGATISAQQIVYVGNLDLTKMPTNPNCLLYWLKQEGALSLYKDGNNLILKEVNIDKEDNYVAQYINLNLYNYLIKQKACEELNQTLNCLPF
jgi:hypothetical protein